MRYPANCSRVLAATLQTVREYALDMDSTNGKGASPSSPSDDLEALAEDVFQASQEARDWLDRWHPVLGASPREAAYDAEGRSRVLQILKSLKYGGVV